MIDKLYQVMTSEVINYSLTRTPSLKALEDIRLGIEAVEKEIIEEYVASDESKLGGVDE